MPFWHFKQADAETQPGDGGGTLKRIESSEDMMGTSIFARNKSGEIFHTYLAFARGIENLMGAFMWLDHTPKGRHQFDDGRSRLSEDGLRDARRDDRSRM